MSATTELLQEILNNKVLLEQLIEAVYANTEPNKIDVGLYNVGIISIFASLLVAFFAFKLNKKQISIADKQAEIAEKQSEIMEQQNKIALFEKRMIIYLEIEGLATKSQHANDIVEKDFQIFTQGFSQDIQMRYYIGYAFLLGLPNEEDINLIEKKGLAKTKEILYQEVCKRIDNLRINIAKSQYLFELEKKDKETLTKVLSSIMILGLHAQNIFDEIRGKNHLIVQAPEPFHFTLERLKEVFENKELLENLKKQVVLYEVKD